MKRDVKKIVKKAYGKIAKSGCGCSCSSMDSKEIAQSIGYSADEAKHESNLGLGCGNPLSYCDLKEGVVVLDLGSGAGFDCFLAAKRVGKSGRVIGVDMTNEMVKKARQNAKKYGHTNIEFVLGEIEKIPIKEKVDVVISNCVINLSPDKEAVFKEAYRVLKKGGKMYISDIVLLKELSQMQRNDKEFIAGCVGGALLKRKYIDLIKKAGFKVRILSEDKEIKKRQYNNLPLESIKIEATK